MAEWKLNFIAIYYNYNYISMTTYISSYSNLEIEDQETDETIISEVINSF